jgi:protein-arginine kinase
MTSPKLDPTIDLVMDEDLANNNWPAKRFEELKAHKPQSLMAQVMDETLFYKLRDVRTPTADWTIARAINTGVQNETSLLGIHAGDYESYTMLKDVFNPVIEKYHQGFSMTHSKHVTDLDHTKLTVSLSEKAEARIVSTRIRVARNLIGFPLNPGGTKASRLGVMKLMEAVFDGFSDSDFDLAGEFLPHAKMTKEQEKELTDDHFLFRGKDKFQAASGYHQFWPHGRGIFQSKDKKFLLWVNEGDHIRIISMQNGCNVKDVFARLARGINAIETGIRHRIGKEQVFVTDPVLGVITCCPSNLGGGMRASVHMLIPKLIQTLGLEEIDTMCRELHCQARGSSGEHSKVVDRVDISNRRRLGYSEVTLVSDMIQCANVLAATEEQLEMMQGN